MSTVEEILAGASEQPVRHRRRRPSRVLRPGRTSAGVTVAGVLAVGSWGLAAELTSAWLGAPTGRLAPLLEMSWGAGIVPASAWFLILGGMLLISLAVLPGRSRLVALETTDADLVIGLTKKGLRRSLVAVALSIRGADYAYVKLKNTQIEVIVVTEALRTGELLREVGAAVGDRLAALGVHGRHDVVVRLRRKRV